MAFTDRLERTPGAKFIAGGTNLIDLMKGDVILLEASVGRYWDDTEGGRVKDWGSTRAYFHLEAVTLLIPGADEAEAGGVASKKGKKALVHF